MPPFITLHYKLFLSLLNPIIPYNFFEHLAQTEMSFSYKLYQYFITFNLILVQFKAYFSLSTSQKNIDSE